MEKKLNCWEYKNCGREGTDDIFQEMETCYAAMDEPTNKINNGKNGGRACWVVAGTFSRGELQCDHAKKLDSCLECDFYNLVKKEEGEKFVTGSELVEIIIYNEKFES